jgi:putative pyruvate formate lyase activating enzyme
MAVGTYKKYNIDKEIISTLNKSLYDCRLCPHKCGADRLGKKPGLCKAGYEPVISSAMAHHGEEPPISGDMGSGTIFFTHCNMKCVYCQNYQISQKHQGRPVTIEELAQKMLYLQKSGCHNINLVSPTIWVPQIVSAAAIAAKKGLSVPMVYNTGGYDSIQTIKLLDGIIDIYMPDMRYSSNEMALRYSGIKNYIENNRTAIKEMYRQVGDLVLDKNGIATKGILIRLLVLPGNIGGVKETLDFIKKELSVNVNLSIMAQYHPEYKACNYPQLSRNITLEEYSEVTDYAEKLGFENGWIQDYGGLSAEEDMFRPDFSRDKVFRYYEE